MNDNRVIIGEREQVGLPISAPSMRTHHPDASLSNVRWVKHNSTFVLEYWNEGRSKWVQVPFIENA